MRCFYITLNGVHWDWAPLQKRLVIKIVKQLILRSEIANAINEYYQRCAWRMRPHAQEKICN